MFTAGNSGQKGRSRSRSWSRSLVLIVALFADVDDSYRMNVIDKIKGLMDEVETIHRYCFFCSLSDFF